MLGAASLAGETNAKNMYITPLSREKKNQARKYLAALRLS